MIQLLLVTYGVAILTAMDIVKAAPGDEDKDSWGLVLITEVPYIVSIQLNTKIICTGSIISSLIAITTANCVVDHPKPHFYTLRAGSSSTSHDGNIHSVKELYYNHYYRTSTTILHDICLMEVFVPFNDSTVKPIPIHSKVLWDGDDNAISYRFRTLQLNDIIVEESIIKSDVRIHNWEYCNNTLSAECIHLTKDVLCSEYVSKDENFVAFDSGSPLVVNDKLVGLFSWSSSNRKIFCFTNVPFFNSVIESIILIVHDKN